MAPLLDETLYCTNTTLDSPSIFPTKKIGKPKKEVSFSVMSDLYLIPNSKDLKKQEREAVYMTRSDFQRIGNENVDTLEQMAGGNFPSTRELYFRGLETLMPEARSKRKQRIAFVVSTILREQAKRNELQPLWLEEFHYTYTQKSQEAAYKKGIWDATEAHRTNTRQKTEVWI